MHPVTTRALGPHFTEVARLLWLRLADVRRQHALAAQIGMDDGYLSKLLWGVAQPGRTTIAQIRAAFPEIDFDAWLVAPRAAFTPPVRRRRGA